MVKVRQSRGRNKIFCVLSTLVIGTMKRRASQARERIMESSVPRLSIKLDDSEWRDSFCLMGT